MCLFFPPLKSSPLAFFFFKSSSLKKLNGEVTACSSLSLVSQRQNAASDAQDIEGRHCCFMSQVSEQSIVQQTAGWVNNHPSDRETHNQCVLGLGQTGGVLVSWMRGSSPSYLSNSEAGEEARRYIFRTILGLQSALCGTEQPGKMLTQQKNKIQTVSPSACIFKNPQASHKQFHRGK